MHIYTDSDAAEQLLISTYEGSRRRPHHRWLSPHHSSPITFDAQIRPDNHGVLLRRTSDQATGYQSAGVAIDGVVAGDWLQPRSNTFHRWLDDTYLVPEVLTAGKTRITITLTPTPSAPPWTASRYRVETLTGP